MSSPMSEESRRILAMLRDDACTVPELAALTGLDRKGVARRLNNMIALGRVCRATGRRKVDGKLYALYGAGAVAGVAEAPPAPHRPRQAGTTVRPCLCCKQPFPSEGPHNRLCYRCRVNAGSVSPFTPDL